MYEQNRNHNIAYETLSLVSLTLESSKSVNCYLLFSAYLRNASTVQQTTQSTE